MQTLLLNNVQARNPQVADVVTNQSRDVIVAHEQDVYGHILTKSDELVWPLGVLQTTALQEV